MSDEKKGTYGWASGSSFSLYETLKQDLKTAMRAKDADMRDAIRQVMSEYPKITVPITLESGKKTTRGKTAEEITDDDILGIIRGLVKSEKMVLEIKGLPSSPYLAALEAYLPRMATREEIRSWIRENIDLAAYKSALQAMGPVMKHFGKLADGNDVKSILKELGEKSTIIG